MHIVFLNPQGNFDKNDSLWTMHPDFGGQLVYVKEVAIEIAKQGHKVDIITRQMDDPKFPAFKEQFDSYNDVDNLRIIRISCGGESFINKELLWEYLDEWTENIIKFYEREGNLFDFMTGHYGDGGLACAMIKEKKNIPYSFTGHSLGAQKFDKLNQNFENYEDLMDRYHFHKRILAENTAIMNSNLIFVSTTQERDQQYTHLLYNNVKHIRNPLYYVVTPPGANTKIFAPYWSSVIRESTVDKLQKTIQRDIEKERQELPYIILASRLDEKKNHIGLIEAYGKSKLLQETCNICISLRGIDNAYQDYSNAKLDEIKIIDKIMTLIQEKNLHGKVMFISINSQLELADTYRFLAERKSIFSLTALYEPFGLAPIEAMSTGLPVAVTKYGGPSEVLKENNEEFGVLLDVFNIDDIIEGLLKAFEYYDYYQSQGSKRVKSKYTWNATAKKYIDSIEKVIKNRFAYSVTVPEYFYTCNIESLDRNAIKKTLKGA